MIAGKQPSHAQPEQPQKIAALMQELALLRLQVHNQADADRKDVLLNRFLAETES